MARGVRFYIWILGALSGPGGERYIPVYYSIGCFFASVYICYIYIQVVFDGYNIPQTHKCVVKFLALAH